jgi:hypothetical protein
VCTKEDEDALRQFIFRAKKKGWLREEEDDGG